MMTFRIFIFLFLVLFMSSVAHAEQRFVQMSGTLEIKHDRPNIADPVYTKFEYSDPQDHLTDRKEFLPTKRVKVTKITVKVDNVSTERGDFFLGDNCLYYGTFDDTSKELLPVSGELHCTGTSVWNSKGYERTLEFPDTLGFTIDAYDPLGCPVNVAVIYPEILKKTDVEMATVSCRIEYNVVRENEPIYKNIRIPYLDQYPDAPTLIRPDVKWYKNWSDGTPLKIVGFSLYYNPKPYRDQTLKDLCVFAMDSAGNKNLEKTICLPDQIYIAGQTHLQYEPSFVEGEFELSEDEYLGGSCSLYKGNKAGDCVLYVMVEIPEEYKESNLIGSPTFYSHGIANLKYLTNSYCNKHIYKQRLTPFGRQVIRVLEKTEYEPWATLRDTKTGGKKNGLSSKACKALFAN